MAESYALYSSTLDAAAQGGVERHPLNFDVLTCGMKIPVEEVERILGVTPANVRFQLKLLALVQQIDREMRIRGHIWTYRTDHGAILICNDSDAAKVNGRTFRQRMRGAFRAHARNVAVDVRKLTEDERKAHERTLLIQGRMLQAAKAAKSRVALESVKRNTPALASPAGEAAL